MYRTIETDFWDDPKFNELGRDVVCLALYLVTNPDSHTTGVYRFRPSVACERMQMSREDFQSAFDKLIQLGFCKWDSDRRVVWVVNMFKRQPHDGLHLNRLNGHFKTLYESPLVDEFLVKYPKCQDMHEPVTNLSRPGHEAVTKLHESALQKKEKKKKTIPDSGESGTTPNSKVYNFFIERRREAIGVADWKPSPNGAKQMRDNINLLLKSNTAEELVSWLANYFTDQKQASRSWPWSFFMHDPIQWRDTSSQKEGKTKPNSTGDTTDYHALSLARPAPGRQKG